MWFPDTLPNLPSHFELYKLEVKAWHQKWGEKLSGPKGWDKRLPRMAAEAPPGDDSLGVFGLLSVW